MGIEPIAGLKTSFITPTTCVRERANRMGPKLMTSTRCHLSSTPQENVLATYATLEICGKIKTKTIAHNIRGTIKWTAPKCQGLHEFLFCKMEKRPSCTIENNGQIQPYSYLNLDLKWYERGEAGGRNNNSLIINCRVHIDSLIESRLSK